MRRWIVGGPVAGLVVVIIAAGCADSAPDMQRIEDPAAGFAISIPVGWKVQKPRTHPDVIWLAGRGVGPNRPRCEVRDQSERPEIWATPEDAEARLRLAEPSRDSVEASYVDLSQGRTLVVDSTWRYPGQVHSRDFVLTDRHRMFHLRCRTGRRVPNDRWQSIAESFEFLPAGSTDSVAAQDG